MKIELVYLNKEKGENTRRIEVDMENLMYIRFILSEENQDHIDIDAEKDTETRGLRVRGGRSIILSPDASNSVSIAPRWKR